MMNAITQIQRANIPAPGTPLAGGFAVKTYRDDDKTYLLITAGAAGEIEGKWLNKNIDVPGTLSCVDGLANTNAMAAAGSPLAIAARESRLNDYDDWHLAARDQEELRYRYLKPTTDKNACSFRDGDNPSALPPTYPYTEENPAQTTVVAFQEGGAEAFNPGWYFTSTQYSASSAYVQDFAYGYQINGSKDLKLRGRLVRRLLVIE